MSTYTNTSYIVSFDSTSPSDNVKKIVHSLADNVTQLSIYEEHEAAGSTYYSGILKYSGYSNLVLKFGVVVGEDSSGRSYPQLKITLGSESFTSPGDYSNFYYFSKWGGPDGVEETVGYINLTLLNNTEHAFKYNVMAFDDVICLDFLGIKSSSGSTINPFGIIMLSPLVDQFTSEKLAGALVVRPYSYHGTGYQSDLYFVAHNGKASQSYKSNQYVTVGGTSYYAGANSVASPIALRSGDYSVIPFYGFMNNSEFLYQIRTGSSTRPLSIDPGAKVEIGGHTFVSLRMNEYLFVRIS